MLARGNPTARCAVGLSHSPRMSSSQSPALASGAPPADDLTELPAPRRPLRRLTFAVMALTAAFAVFLAIGLRGELVYALRSGAPRDVGELGSFDLDGARPNQWVRGGGALSSTDVVRYFRPLERDGYRLARLEGNPRLWVELRLPPGADGARFVAPGSFVGRLVPSREAGLRYGALAHAVAEAGRPALAADTWLLIDGESPRSTRWVLGLFVVLLGFIAFNVIGLVRLSRRVRDV